MTKKTMALFLVLIISIGVNLLNRNGNLFIAHLLFNLAFVFILLGSPVKGWGNLALLVSSLFLSFVVVELYFTWSQTKAITYTKLIGGNGALTKTDETLGYNANPGRYIAKKCLGNCEEQVVYDVKYSVGPQGYRLTPQADTSHLTAIFFGDSFTFGVGVNDDETLPYYFSRQNPTYSVYNLGLGGYGPQQMLRQLETANFSWHTGQNVNLMVFQTSPTLADRSYCIPSFSSGTPKYRLIDGEISLVGKCWGRHGFAAKILRRSMTYKTFRSRILPRFFGFDEKIDLYLKIIEKSSRLAKKKFGSRFVVAYLRADNEYFEPSQYSNERILKYFSENGIEYVDITLATDDGRLATELVIVGDGHPSALAHSKRADVISAFLQ